MFLLGAREEQNLVLPTQLVIDLNNHIITNTNALAAVALNTDGSMLTISAAGGVLQPTEWARPLASTNGSGYEAQVTVGSGSINQGNNVGEWLPLTSNRSWGVQEMGSTQTCTFTLEIRPIGGTVVASCNITVTSTYAAP